ncbi:MAG: hypothetical protein NW215_09430 [Hyphomicrobiales bacterium]|nr:hypothetical protein [Hyphomicrobiales bacterium]
MLLHHQTLDERAIIKTLAELRNRVAERFPTRGLTQTVTHLHGMARATADEAKGLRRPNWTLRLIAGLTIAAGLFAFAKLVTLYRVALGGEVNLTEFAQGLEAALNIILICALIIAFFLRLENRHKRRVALEGLHRLRAIAHVIDMHQLTKDPISILGKPTGSSPRRDLSREQLLRYLDYCTEMLSLTSKLGALYAQHFPDQVVVGAVNDVEELTTSLSRKIWQKIAMVQAEAPDPAPQL